MERAELRVALLGASYTGKSSFIKRVISGQFHSRGYRATGLEFREYETSSPIVGTALTITFLDTSGRYPAPQFASYVTWADIILLFYSISDTPSFLDAARIGHEIRKLDSHIPIVVVGAKSDEDERMRRIVPDSRCRQLASKLETHFYGEISSKNGTNIQEAILHVCAFVLESRRGISEQLNRVGSMILGFSDGSGEEIAVPGRVAIKDGPVQKVSRSTSTKKADRHFWLFNDMIVYTKSRQNNTGAAQFCGSIPLRYALVLDCYKVNSDASGTAVGDGDLAFAIARIDTREVIEFICRSRGDKDDWIDKIEELLIPFATDEKRAVYSDNIALFHVQYQLAHLSNKRVFGVPIRCLMRKQPPEATTPVILSRLINHIIQHASVVPGLFRLPGLDDVATFRSNINSGHEVDLAVYDELSICMFILAFLRQLPFGLVPQELNVALMTLRPADTRQDKIHKMREILFCMPKENLALLSEVCRFVLALTCKSARNLVTVPFAAKLFSPALLRIRDPILAMEAMTTLIVGAEQLFTAWPSFKKKKMVPGPEYLVQVNSDRMAQRIEISRAQLLRLQESIRSAPKSDQNDVDMAVQELIAVLNTLASYELTFVHELLDTSNLDNFYVQGAEVERRFRETQRKASSRLNMFMGGSVKSFSQIIKQFVGPMRSELEQFYSYLDSLCNWTADEREAYFKLKKKNDHTMQIKQAVGLAVEPQGSFTQSFKMIENLFSDPAARTWWDQNFGLERFNVPLDNCFICLSKFCGTELSEKHAAIFLFLIDPDRRGVVNIHRFAQFLGVYGPIRSSIQNFASLLNEPWFYGFLSEQDSKRLLETEHPGAYLARFASSTFGDIAIDHVVVGLNGLELKTVRVTLSTQGYTPVDSQSSVIYRTFPEFVHANDKLLVSAFNTDLVRESYFHGELSNQETEHIMHGAAEGSFLVRFGTQPRTLVVSWIAEGGVLYHFKLERFGGSIQVQQGSTVYPNISECIRANEQWLQKPVPTVKTPQRTSMSSPLRPESQSSGLVDLNIAATMVTDSYSGSEGGADVPSRHAVAAVVEKLYDGANLSATNIFLLTYRAFSTPVEVLETLREKYRASDKISRLRISNFLKIWITEYFWDVQGEDDKMFFDKYRLFASQDIVQDSQTLSAQLLSILQKQLLTRTSRGRVSIVDTLVDRRSDRVADDRSKHESWTALRSSMLAESTGSTIAKSLESFTLLDIDITIMAKQLSLMEHELFMSIQPWEFLNQGWLKRDKEKRSPNLLKMIRFSNKISQWVVSEIVAEEQLKKRVQIIDYFVALGKELRSHRNFNGVMEILAGISNASIFRMKKTWESFRASFATKRSKRGVISSDIDELDRLSNTDDNWSIYRQALAAAPPPKIPYLGLVLTDLVYCEEGNPSRLPNGDINWTRCERISDLLQSLKLAQLQQYQYDTDISIVDYVLEFPLLSENEAHQRSLQVEPREGMATSSSSLNLLASSPKI